MINCDAPTKCNRCTWNPTYFSEIKETNRKESEERFRIAMARQNPKKALISYSDEATPVCLCPECQQNLYVEQKYCDVCGQKISWRDMKER